MDFMQKCRMAADRLETLGDACRRSGSYIAAGHTTNFDILAEWQPEHVDELIAQYLKTDIPHILDGVEAVNTPDDLLCSLISHVHHGIGGEVEIHNESMCRFITENFAHKPALGGTGIQAAAALSVFHVPVILHPTDCSNEVLGQVADKDIFFVDGGRLCRSGEFPESKKTPPTPHFIFQFVKGDWLHIQGKGVEAARSNRLIVTYDKINQELPLSEEYFRYLEANAAHISSYIVSGFNCILDEAVLHQRIDRFITHISALRRSNPSVVVYLEDAFYHRFSFKVAVYRGLLPECDILGFNEEELGELTRYFGINADFDDIESIADVLRFIRMRFPVRRGVVLHSKDYALFYGDRSGMDIEMGLTYANLLACTRANFGHYGSLEEARQIAGLPPCERGARFAEKAHNAGLDDRMVIVPSIEIGVPRYTIGLGDTFVGGLQLCFCR